MSRHAQAPLLARRWRSLLVAAVLLVLSGAVLLVWQRVDAEAHRADQLGAEAVRRGDAVTTLAEDVRILREQVKAEGGTPAAPDPARAVDDLPDRVEAVPGTPGAQGERGPQGPAGADGKNGRDGENGDDGASGASGTDGAAGEPGPAGPSGPPGPPGEDGKDGADGTDGRDGASGQTCPDGYSLQAPEYDPDALVCRRDGAPPPEDPTPSPPTNAALIPERKRS